jgi:hypothetical protein
MSLYIVILVVAFLLQLPIYGGFLGYANKAMVTSSSLGRSPFAISSSNEAAANPYGKTRPKNVSSKGDFELGAQAHRLRRKEI